MIKSGTLIVLAAVMACLDAAPTDDGKISVRILHTNDMHSRFEEVSQSTGICTAKDAEMGKCYGGFARIATLVRRARAEATNGLPTFFLNAGDTYLGSKLFTYYKWKIVARFLNILRPDVVSLGNHEFDQEVSGLIPFLNNATFPVVAANLDLTAEPELQRTRALKKSTILMAKNRKIGVIGYLTAETKFVSRPGNVVFIDEVIAVREEAKKLKAQGCDIIIALGHSGYFTDQRIGREVEDVDLVIGGHTNTFLYTGTPPDSNEAEGLYPTVVVQPSGRKVYVVQAYMATKYIGDLTIDFDARGEITRIEGNPKLVDNSVPKAQDVEDELKVWVAPLINYAAQVVGETKVYLQGDEKVCRLMECNMGNFITDAMVFYNANRTTVDNGWTDAAIGIHQSGGIRTSIDYINDNKVTMDDVITAFPFGAKLVKVDLDAKTLMKVLEWSVHDRLTQNTTSHGGGFLQFSGLQVTYDVSKPLESRVVSVKVRCSLCIVPTFQDIDMNANYKVVMTDFLTSGGDGFTMLKTVPRTDLNITVADVVAKYINHTGPVYPDVEGRIQFVLPKACQKASPNSAGRLVFQFGTAVLLWIGLVSTRLV